MKVFGCFNSLTESTISSGLILEQSGNSSEFTSPHSRLRTMMMMNGRCAYGWVSSCVKILRPRHRTCSLPFITWHRRKGLADIVRTYGKKETSHYSHVQRVPSNRSRLILFSYACKIFVVIHNIAAAFDVQLLLRSASIDSFARNAPNPAGRLCSICGCFHVYLYTLCDISSAEWETIRRKCIQRTRCE